MRPLTCLVLVAAAACPVAADDLCARACAHNATLYGGNPKEPDCLEDCAARRFDPDCALKTKSLEELAGCARGRSLAAERREPWQGAKKMLAEGRKLPGGSCDQIAKYGKCDDFSHDASIGWGKGGFCKAFGSGGSEHPTACPTRSLGTCLYDAGEHADHYYARGGTFKWTVESAASDCGQTGGVWVPRHVLPGSDEARKLGPPYPWNDPRMNK